MTIDKETLICRYYEFKINGNYEYLIKINIRDCFFRKEFYPFCKVLSVTKVYRLPIDSLLICKHLRLKKNSYVHIIMVGIPLYKIPFLFYFHLNSILFQVIRTGWKEMFGLTWKIKNKTLLISLTVISTALFLQEHT